jgi:uncharacterized protein (TIGR00251 family)
MVDLQETTDGVIVPVRAQARARRNAIVGTHAGYLKIAVTDPPEKGKANQSIAGILAAALEIAPSRVQLVAGATSGQKRFLIVGLVLPRVLELLSASLPCDS